MLYLKNRAVRMVLCGILKYYLEYFTQTRYFYQYFELEILFVFEVFCI